jgi:hypothetical protein
VLFSSDALEKLGVIAKSPGAGFFTAFVDLDPAELERLKIDEKEIVSGAFGETTEESLVFSGRGVTGRTINPEILPDAFVQGFQIPINRCRIRPVSTQQKWDQSLFITAKEVVLDPARTWDPCTGAGTQGGVWTFAHLIREMAIGSGTTPENFALSWLSMWLNNYVVNGDTVAARTQMFNQVIQPWATASGVTATLVIDTTGFRRVRLSGPLNLNIAPFRLLAIVNRIDLGATEDGPGGYGGGTISRPVTAGELRFIFNVVQPNPWGAGTEGTCGRKLFTTIFEYGVPGTGCERVVDWAKRWTSLQQFPGFTGPYLAKLASMTESVVVSGAAPGKGNQNAINQIRTNEIALSGPWELREFTLTKEDPLLNIDPPASGLLQKHTVAQTPNEGAYAALGPDPAITAFVNGPVTANLNFPVLIPTRCSSDYTVPFFFGGRPFRGGNALIGPGHWRANVPFNPIGICSRFAFSLNTCHGCHQDDSGTNGFGGSTFFTHVDPLSSIPVTLSKFLTGGGPGLVFNVPDAQFGGPAWPFADLQRRLERLFDLSHCTSCLRVRPSTPVFVERMQEIGPVPADFDPTERQALQIGPITDLGAVEKLLDLRAGTLGEPVTEPADFIRRAENVSH